MTKTIVLKPGRVPLAAWRDIYRGAPATLDPFSRADIEAAAGALQAIRNGEPQRENGSAPSQVAAKVFDGESMPAAVTRLVVALKLASLGQGLSGVRWKIVERLSDFLADDVLPVLPATGGESSLSYIAAAIEGRGDVLVRGRRSSFVESGLAPLALNDDERIALCSGAQVETAFALAGLFEAENAFHSALVAAALSERALGAPHGTIHPRVLGPENSGGLAEVARTMAKFSLNGAAAPASSGRRAKANGTWRDGTAAMGACLDLLRQAGAILERAANTVSEARLVVWQSGEVTAGLADTASPGMAADLIAFAFREIAALSGQRIATLAKVAGVESVGAEASTPLHPATNLLGEIRDRAFPSGLGAHDEGEALPLLGVRRLLPMAGPVAIVVLTECVMAVKVMADEGFEAGEMLGPVVEMLKTRVPTLTNGHAVSALDVAMVADLVGSGAMIQAAGLVTPMSQSPKRQRDPKHESAETTLHAAARPAARASLG